MSRTAKIARHMFKIREKYLSHFVFVHINKTGGTSIAKALRLPLEHRTAHEKLVYMGQERWNKKFSFCFVRNPWDKVVSHYHYRVSTNQSNMAVDAISFGDWVRRAYQNKEPKYFDVPRMFSPQIDWMSDQNGNNIISYAGRYENLQEDFDFVCNKIEIAPIKLPHLKASYRSNYQDYYDKQSKFIVASHFRKDIKAFGYYY
ncbi:MAG: hypothetical protein CALGDGBN_00689 [Pseudomonadales bacterium]|nr:hypothetical protein [Pseudomonadales bacterium]